MVGGVAFRVALALLAREAVKNGGRGRGFSFFGNTVKREEKMLTAKFHVAV